MRSVLRGKWLPLLFLLLCGSGCPDSRFVSQALSAKLDPGLSKAERSLLKKDLKFLMSLPLQEKAGGTFEKAFGGSDIGSVFHYLGERINLILPPEPGGHPGAGAENLGLHNWLLAVADGKEAPGSSPRVGVIRLGLGYANAHILRRSLAWVHEARHSDCTGGLRREQAVRYARGDYLGPQSCGHLHAMCPPGHPYAQLQACDGHAWGAYSMEALMLNAVLKSCDQCSREVRTAAQALLLEALSRISVRDDMFAGKLGDPDMSSTGVISD